MKCIVCGREIESGKKEIHHISYPVEDYPEVTIPLHKKCHHMVHHTNYYSGLKPRYGHSKIYYGGEDPDDEESKMPLEKFIDDMIVVEEGSFVEKHKMFDIFREYCEDEEIIFQPSNYGIFIRKLNNLVEEIYMGRKTLDGEPKPILKHIKIKNRQL